MSESRVVDILHAVITAFWWVITNEWDSADLPMPLVGACLCVLLARGKRPVDQPQLFVLDAFDILDCVEYLAVLVSSMR